MANKQVYNPLEDEFNLVSDATLLPGEVTKASTDTLTAAEVSSKIINNYGQAAETTLTLPTVFKGLNAIFQISTEGAGAFHIKLGPSDKVKLNGTWLDDGDKISNETPLIGDTITVLYLQTGASSYDCIARTAMGTWIDGGA